MDTLPLFPLGSVLLPGGHLPLHIFEPRYRQLVTDLLREELPDRRFGVVAIKQGWEVGEDNVDSMYDVGCSALLDQVRQLPGGRYDVSANGERRFRLLQIDRSAAPYVMANVEWLPDTAPENDSPARREHLTTAARAAYQRYHATGLRGGPRETPGEDADAATLSYLLADDCVLTVEDRQDLLAETDPLARLREVRRLLLREAEFLRELRAVPAPLTEFAQHTSVN
ncbi:LON peptidase substrate-binding domain-containing protein [Saccharopolyspora sp. K220]|uniref:LON peptidase substrate-binding domain-containing protein n=1 Tax=Saccharopolyspora soli TaxID=2926618 RepID=UPI001F58C059|nr:LON peptidase substrate-binding domain-containing protein [Saccharopolyspora soli]MCI2420511.1 LON peptidase substrate-binding domain-containing protein [Saccharopolyspora soli]